MAGDPNTLMTPTHPRAFGISLLQQVNQVTPAAASTWVALYSGRQRAKILRVQWRERALPPRGLLGQAHRIQGLCACGAPCRVAPSRRHRLSPLEESARWRAAPTRHHALQAPTDRLPTATRCALHPPLAHRCLLWVRLCFFVCICGYYTKLLFAFVVLILKKRW